MTSPRPPIRAALGRAVRRLRLAGGRSQEAFADHAGVHRTYVGSVERGEVNVSLDNLDRLAGALGVSLSQLLAEAETERVADNGPAGNAAADEGAAGTGVGAAPAARPQEGPSRTGGPLLDAASPSPDHAQPTAPG